MRDIQEIFNAVIFTEHYARWNCETRRGDPYMCNALENSQKLYGVITLEEYYHAIREIKRYITGDPYYSQTVTLANALEVNGLKHSFEARLAIYKDWVNRPPLPIFEEEE